MSDDDESVEPSPPTDPFAPPKRKKKRKRRASAEADASEGGGDVDQASVGAGQPFDDTPAFARGFPSDPALDALVAAFEAGDYARVRREAPALAKSTDSDDVRRAARELRRRLDPDPVAVYLLSAAAALLAFLSLWYWSHGHAAP